MKKEMVLGAGIGVLAFLLVMGVNILPVVFVGTLAVFAYYLLQQSGNGLVVRHVAQRTSSGVQFDDIGGQKTAAGELKEALDFLLADEKAKRLGIRPLKGILLVGPPGTGKTLLAKAAATHTDSAFLATDGSSFVEMYAGVGAKRVRQVFADARKLAREEGKKSAIIFIDELEVMVGKRGSHESHLEYDQTLNQLLVEMDGMRSNDDVRILVIGATNRADLIDPALLRPGRFDRQVRVDLPDREGRLAILSIHARNKPLGSDADLDEVAAATFGFSGAELEAVVNEAAILALRDDAAAIGQHHLMEAVEKVMIGEKSDRKPSDLERTRIAVHEAGHAVVSELLDSGSVNTITIVPRGQAMGYMRPSAQADRHLFTREYVKTQIMVALAGAAAETCWFGDFCTGARNDFERAWGWAKEMVLCGFSRLGVVVEQEVPPERLFEECSYILIEYREQTTELVRENRGLLERAVSLLLAKETVHRYEWEALLAS